MACIFVLVLAKQNGDSLFVMSATSAMGTKSRDCMILKSCHLADHLTGESRRGRGARWGWLGFWGGICTLCHPSPMKIEAPKQDTVAAHTRNRISSLLVNCLDF